jgi:hypothetical protein
MVARVRFIGRTLWRHGGSAENLDVPRPKRPRRLLDGLDKNMAKFANLAPGDPYFVGDVPLAESANFEPGDPAYVALKAKAVGIVENYCSNVWTPGTRSGRRPVTPRDEKLIAKLAHVFHEHSHWAGSLNWDSDPDYVDDYESYLVIFVVLMLVNYDIKFPFNIIPSGKTPSGRRRFRCSLLEKIPPAYRVPRSN